MNIDQQRINDAKGDVDALVGLPGQLMRRGHARGGNRITGFVEYHYSLLRDADKRFLLFVEWVDIQGQGHRERFPHAMVLGIVDRYRKIITQSRKEGAQAAQITKAAKDKTKGA